MHPARLKAAKVIIHIISVFTIVSPYIFDWNITHIYNPRWPPHAKFHNAQTMMLGTLMGICALLFLWIIPIGKRNGFLVGAVFASLYWVAQIGAFFFPGTALVDPEFIGPNNHSGGQIYVDAVVLSLVFIASLLAYLPVKQLKQ